MADGGLGQKLSSQCLYSRSWHNLVQDLSSSGTVACFHPCLEVGFLLLSSSCVLLPAESIAKVGDPWMDWLQRQVCPSARLSLQLVTACSVFFAEVECANILPLACLKGWRVGLGF